jgi:hypothetical protein
MKIILFLISIIVVMATLVPYSQAGGLDQRYVKFGQYKWTEQCETDFRESLKSIGVKVENLGITEFSLSPDIKILQIQCGIFPYQSTYEYIRVYKPTSLNFSYPLRFRTKIRKPSGVISNLFKRQLLGNPIVTVSPFKITNLEKGRGLGDCGTFESFYGFISSPFMLATIVKTHPNCDGNTDYNTWESLI